MQRAAAGRVYQTASRDPVTLIFPITNGNAKTRGFEAEAVWRPVGQSDFALNLGVAYTDAEWGRFPAARRAGGQLPPFTPKWAFNISPNLSHPTGIGAVDDAWKVSVFGKNLTGERFRTFQFNNCDVYESRRIIGVSLDVAL